MRDCRDVARNVSTKGDKLTAAAPERPKEKPVENFFHATD
jgi:hypothetical protein